MQDIIIRRIELADNPFMATIIRESLAEFGANKPGTVFYDDTTDHLFELFQQPGSFYYVAEKEKQLIGGAGIYPSPGLPAGVAELVKMYLKKEARGIGLGRELIGLCIKDAATIGYRTIYLETMPELKKQFPFTKSLAFSTSRARWEIPGISDVTYG